ncbi:sulfite exporter TauE/SafE family protein [Methylophaga sp.]|uniref:sulfite exporter TauE/SafE family protein n=1 Tax=Methylophaga sp. TaxID=2024840 RepID=UPI00272376B6|nr:sulfite exporter TauE/SafE family protein [Methylophaga sp.]MDO8827239.1 sulfite exporter TauE/SafE family protein [Methylophaga sp.]
MDALTTSLVTAFLLGLFSSAHCIAMCGSVIGALTLTLPVEIRQQPRKMFPFVFNYNVGRILSYAIAGSIVGFLASPLAQINGLSVLRYLSVLVMIGMGLYLAGWFPKFAHAEKIGAPIWRKLQPIGQKLLPVRTLKQAFLLGAVWGWLPCGLVYAGLAVAATTGDPLYAASVMLAFGLGTLPAVMGAGMFAGMLASLARNQLFRKLAGLLIIVMALLLLLWPHGGHHDHEQGEATPSTEMESGHDHSHQH